MASCRACGAADQVNRFCLSCGTPMAGPPDAPWSTTTIAAVPDQAWSDPPETAGVRRDRTGLTTAIPLAPAEPASDTVLRPGPDLQNTVSPRAAAPTVVPGFTPPSQYPQDVNYATAAADSTFQPSVEYPPPSPLGGPGNNFFPPPPPPYQQPGPPRQRRGWLIAAIAFVVVAAVATTAVLILQP
jgi:hypothetical protein